MQTNSRCIFVTPVVPMAHAEFLLLPVDVALTSSALHEFQDWTLVALAVLTPHKLRVDSILHRSRHSPIMSQREQVAPAERIALQFQQRADARLAIQEPTVSYRFEFI